MIITPLNRLERYTLFPFLAEIKSFLTSHEMGKVVEGDYEIRGKDLYYRVLRYMPRVPSEVKLETHSIYTDVHILLEGMERVPTALPEQLISMSEYDLVNDVQFFSVSQYLAEVTFHPQMLAVFFPGEAHVSMRYHDFTDSIKKLVFKVRQT